MTPSDTFRLWCLIQEIVELTGLARSPVYRAISARTLRARKCGRRTVILADDLRQFLVGLQEVG